MKTSYKYNTLEDFLISHQLTVDAVFDDGWGANFPVKGIELEATILFVDISSFSKRTAKMSPVETLIFVNNFFSWITAEALLGQPFIVDKYIGDEVMVLFSKEFGSDDPFIDAIKAARRMAEQDALSFSPHIGVASGPVVAGYVGTPVKYNASLFGAAVTLAARCASEKPHDKVCSSTITFPASEWCYGNLNEVFVPRKYKLPDGKEFEKEHAWKLLDAQTVELKNIGRTSVRQIVNQAFHFPQQSAEERAAECYRMLRNNQFRGNNS